MNMKANEVDKFAKNSSRVKECQWHSRLIRTNSVVTLHQTSLRRSVSTFIEIVLCVFEISYIYILLSLITYCRSLLIVTHYLLSLITYCHSLLIVTHYLLSLITYCHSLLIVTHYLCRRQKNRLVICHVCFNL